MRDKKAASKAARPARNVAPAGARAKKAKAGAKAKAKTAALSARAAVKRTTKVPSANKRRRGRREPKSARFALGDVVRHRIYPFRGVIFDIDPVFANTEDWWLAIPEQIRPKKDQPFYHLLAENEETEYIAYVSEQNLVADDSGEPLRHPRLSEFFTEDESGRLRVTQMQSH